MIVCVDGARDEVSVDVSRRRSSSERRLGSSSEDRRCGVGVPAVENGVLDMSSVSAWVAVRKRKSESGLSKTGKSG